jgi:hypothetical protein
MPKLLLALLLILGLTGCVALLGDFELGGAAQDGGADDGMGEGAGIGVVEGHDDAGAVCACLSEPPAGWMFVTMSTTQTACEDAWAGSSSTSHDGLTAAGATCSCTCATSGTGCQVSYSFNGDCGYACSGGCTAGYTNLTLASGTCVPAVVQANAYQALSTPTGGESCTPQPTTTIPPVAWAETITACGPTSAIGHGSCGIGSACVAAAPAGFKVCIEQAGDLSCPFGAKQLEYAGATDTRACSTCTCGEPAGAVCGGATVGYATADCTGTSFPLACGPSANSVEYVAAPSGTCASPVPISATGAAMPSGPITFCCL